MKVFPNPLGGVMVLAPQVHWDERGSFTELYRADEFAALGISRPFVQDNRSLTRKGCIRGLHFQLLHPQAKLVRVEQGTILDVVVDVRVGSPTFGHFFTVMLSEDGAALLYVPRGFAHGFLAVSPWAAVAYKTDDYYSGSDDQKGIRYSDPSVNIPWPKRDVRVSDKDAALPFLAQLSSSELPRYEPEP